MLTWNVPLFEKIYWYGSFIHHDDSQTNKKKRCFENLIATIPGGRLNIKMPSYQYRDSHVKDKTVSPTVLSLTWESLYLGKTVFILRQGPEHSKPERTHRLKVHINRIIHHVLWCLSSEIKWDYICISNSGVWQLNQINDLTHISYSLKW